MYPNVALVDTLPGRTWPPRIRGAGMTCSLSIESFVNEFLARSKRSPNEVILTQEHLHRLPAKISDLKRG